MLVKEDGNGLISMLRDSKLSLKAKGLLAYLSKCPEQVDVTIEYIAADSTDGEKAIAAALKEAEAAGYLERERVRDKKGHYRNCIWRLKV